MPAFHVRYRWETAREPLQLQRDQDVINYILAWRGYEEDVVVRVATAMRKMMNERTDNKISCKLCANSVPVPCRYRALIGKQEST